MGAPVIATSLAMLMVIALSALQTSAIPLIVFGDSLSDNGNSLREAKKNFPPNYGYWNGRYTSAPGNWLDYLAVSNKQYQIINRAYGGATACDIPNYVPSVVNRTAVYLKKPIAGKKIVVFWGGHNDIMKARKAGSFAGAIKVPFNIGDCLTKSAASVLKADKDATVIIGTLATLDQSPLGKVGLGTLEISLRLTIAGINKGIKKNVAALQKQYPGRVILFDVNASMKFGLDNSKKLGFKYPNTTPCVVLKPSFPVIFDGIFGPKEIRRESICKDPLDHVFFDPIHPSSRAHKLVVHDPFVKLLRANKL